MELGQRRSLFRVRPQGIGVQNRVVTFAFELSRARLCELAQVVVDEVLELVHIGLVSEEFYEVCQLVLSTCLLKFLLQLLLVDESEQVVPLQDVRGHALLADQLAPLAFPAW